MDEEQTKIVSAWNILGGKVDFSALDDVSEYLEVVDIELFIDGLLLLKKHNDDHSNHTD